MQVDVPGVLCWRGLRTAVPYMTAISIVYTAEGFVIASDGRIRWADTPDDRPSVTEDAKKIFKSDNGKMAYAVAGLGKSASGAFDMLDECRAQADTLKPEAFHSCYEYLDAFARNLKCAIAEAKRDGRIEHFTERSGVLREDRYVISKLFAAGYFADGPCWGQATISHCNQSDVVHRMTTDTLMAGRDISYGSQTILELGRSCPACWRGESNTRHALIRRGLCH
jgi:hypothetical protein